MLSKENLKAKTILCLLAGLILGLVSFEINVPGKETGSSKRLLRISQAVDVETIDPALAKSVEEGNVIEQIFEGLTAYDPKTSSPVPGVAKKWKISSDLKTYTFYLRKDARWSDGSPVLAADFVYAWRRILEPKTGSSWAYQLFDIKGTRDYYEGKEKDFGKVGITAKSDHVLLVELRKPLPYFLGWLSHSSMCPVKSSVVDGHGKAWTHSDIIVSNGAFVVTYREPNDKIILKRNPYYWDAKKVWLREVHYLPVENEATGLKMYDTGLLEIDGGGLPLARIDVLKKRKDIEIANYLGVYFYRFNVTKAPFDDVRVRRAFNLAVDKRVITDRILKGGQKYASNIVPEGISWYDPEKGDGYNPVLAKKLFAQAAYCAKGYVEAKDGGCKKFPKVEILFNTLGNHRKIAEAVQAMLDKNLGLSNLKVVNRDFKTVQSLTKRGDYMMVRGGWIGDFVDPATFLAMWTENGANNLTGWKNKKYDELISQAEQTIDLAKRARIFRESERILNEELPFLPIYFFARLYLKKNFVRGYYSNILDKHPLKYVYFSN